MDAPLRALAPIIDIYRALSLTPLTVDRGPGVKEGNNCGFLHTCGGRTAQLVVSDIEGYRAHAARRATDRRRDYEADAHEAEAMDEKIYE